MEKVLSPSKSQNTASALRADMSCFYSFLLGNPIETVRLSVEAAHIGRTPTCRRFGPVSDSFCN